jgi:ABC transport system ATP-binding/permease protein
MFKLVIQDDEGKTTVVPLVRDEITIGRKEGNTIRLTERNVSRRHARIIRNNGEVTIEDLGSYNGIRVNNARIAERVHLRISDQVQIGDYKLFLKAESIEHVDEAKTVPIERVETATSVDTLAAAEAAPGSASALGTAPPSAQMSSTANRTKVAIADTDPAGRPIASAAVVASLSAPVGHSRLVVLSSNFAGSEFELSRPQMIIGRTDENDIVVNHRSISRNHAKIVREPDTGRYTVSDLQSSNGVRVNGQDYGKVELRRGDVIDLGHVRMRFVEAGEEYVFSRDAIEDVPEEGRGKGLWVAIALAALLLGGIGLYFLIGRNSDPPTPDSATRPGSGDATAAVAMSPDAAAVDSEPDAPPPSPPLAPDATVTPVSDDVAKRKRSDCAQLQSEERWADLKKCAADLRAIKGLDQADVAAANEFAKQSGIEIISKAQFDQFLAAEKKDDLRGMNVLVRQRNNASMYAKQMDDKWDAAKSKYVNEKTARAKALARGGRCSELRAIAASVRAYDPRNADEIMTLSCSTATVSDAGSNGSNSSASDCGDMEQKVKAIFSLRDVENDRAIREAEQALSNPCFAAKKKILVRVGLDMACRAKRPDKVLHFFKMGGKDPFLVSTCPDVLTNVP